MLCENCNKNEATGYFEKTVNGVKTRQNLCSACLMKKQKEMFGGFNMFSGIAAPVKQKYVCSKCGTTLNEIADSCFVGCPDCYAELSQQILPIIRNIQNASRHIGSAPGGSQENAPGEYAKLKIQLQKAIDEERFEDAGEINRKIKQLREGK